MNVQILKYHIYELVDYTDDEATLLRVRDII